MSKEMIVSVNGREKKIAILDTGKVTEFYIERGEENSGVSPGATLVLRLPEPGGFLEHHALEVLVLLERTVQRGRVLPELEDPADPGIGVGDEAGQRVGVVPIEGLLAALVGKLHQVGQGQHRVPRRLGHHLYREALVLQGLRGA